MTKKEEFVNAVNQRIRGWTTGPGGSMGLNEAGRSHAAACFDRGIDVHTVADGILSSTEDFLNMLVADWDDAWF